MPAEEKVKWKRVIRAAVGAAGGSVKRKALKKRLLADLAGAVSAERLEELLDDKVRAAGFEIRGKVVQPAGRAPGAQEGGGPRDGRGAASMDADGSGAAPAVAAAGSDPKKRQSKPGGAPLPCTAAEAAAFWKEHMIAVSGEGASEFRPCLAFDTAGFDADVLRATATFAKPTPIQSTCWPVALAGRDVIGIAETGSGKTLGFFLPALMHLRAGDAARRRGVRVLVLSPTRELAMQTETLVAAAGEHCGVRSVCVFGGVPKGPQAKALRGGVDVVVATPGRLLDLYQNDRVAELSHATYVVLDEADRLLDLGFEKDVRAIVSATAAPPARQTCMFTATWPDGVRKLASDFLTRPITITVGSTELTANHRVKQVVEVVEPHAKDSRLLQLLKQYHGSRKNRVLIFALYKKEAARVEGQLQRAGYNCRGIHGDLSQDQRSEALHNFKQGACPLLIATDVAARGLDIPDVEAVINFTFPLTIEDYIHRIGRTGRAGKSGVSHTLFTQHDKANAGALQNVLREANQDVPEALLKFGSTVKKKDHKLYGAFGPKDDGPPMKTATKITFGED